MYLDNLVPHSLSIIRFPQAFITRLRYPTLVSFGLLANLSWHKRQGLFQEVDAIVDIGANIGQFAFMIHSVLPNLSVYSFEPDPKCFAELQGTFNDHEIPGKCFPYAISATEGDVVLNLYEASANNSLLARDGEVANNHVSVSSKSLDKISIEFGRVKNAFLKIDVQGAELHVLRGAREFLSNCKFVLVEVSLSGAYAGNALIEEVFLMLRNYGFVCREIVDILRDSKRNSSSILEMDLLFFRE